MAEQVTNGEGGEVDYGVHERDYSRVMKLLKWGAIVSAIAALFVMYILAN